jgi:thiamine pyrophosphokinase
MGTEGITALLIGAGPGGGLRRLAPSLRGDEWIICADGGLQKALEVGLTPNCYVGDSDSGGYLPEGVDHWLLPSEKDLTDLEMAVEKAVEAGATQVILCGCTGGRLDHHLANLYLLERLHRRGIHGIIVDEENEITYLAPGTYTLHNRPKYHYFSLLPLDAQLEGVTISGGKYPLNEQNVPRGSTLTVSNEFVDDEPVTLSFTAGGAFLIRSVPEE